MPDYVGPRPVFPGQNYNDWVHNTTGEVGIYSNWSLQSSTHLLQGMPVRDHVPGEGYHPNDTLMTQIWSGQFEYNPMEGSKFSPVGQSAPYMRFDQWQFQGVDSAEIFPSDEPWGYDYVADPRHADRRLFTYSRFSNLWFRGVDSADSTFEGHEIRYYGDPEAPAYFGRYQPWVNQGVTETPLKSPSRTVSDKQESPYGNQRTAEWFGVASAKAL
jgi:hypothetical protein